MNCCPQGSDANPLERPAGHGGKRRVIKNSSIDCPSAIEERETRYYEYQPVMREDHKDPG